MKNKLLNTFRSVQLFGKSLKGKITLAALLILCLLWNACKKEALPLTEKVFTVNNVQKSTLEFIEKAKLLKKEGHINLRTDTYYNVADALDLLNDALNLNYCRPVTEYASLGTFKDSTNMSLTITSTISETNLLILFNNIAITSGAHYYSESDTTKAPFIFEVVQANNLNGSTLPIHVYFTISKGVPLNTPSYPYGEDEDWKWAYNGGKCVDPVDLYDAADIFRNDLRKNRKYKNSHPYYFKNRYSVCFVAKNNSCGGYELLGNFDPSLSVDGDEILNPSDVTPNDNLNDFLLFENYSNYSNYHDCLSDSEMNFYYEQMNDLVTAYIPTQKVIGNIEVGYNELNFVHNRRLHIMRVDYFTVITTDSDPGEPIPCPSPPCDH